MRALLQRVTRASVTVDGELISAQAPSVFKQASGTLEVRDLRVTGNAMETNAIKTLHAVVESGRQRSFNAEFAFSGLDPIELRRGPIELVHEPAELGRLHVGA